MRILWLTPGFAADEADLNCIPPLQRLAWTLQEQGADLTILTIDYPFQSKPYRWHGIPVYPFNGSNRRWLRLWTWSRLFRKASRLHRENRFDAIHCFWLGPAWFIGKRLAGRWKTPCLTLLMGQDVLRSNRYLPMVSPGEERSLIALSNFQREIFEQNTGLKPAYVAPWGIAPADIPDWIPADKTLDILGCGSLIPVKNWNLWLETVAEVKKKIPDIRAEIIGDGPERDRLAARIQALGLEEQVSLTGSLPRPNVLSRMLQTKVLLHTAQYESFGYVVPEALANGCRVVGTPVGITPELVETAEDSASLASLVLKALALAPLNRPFVPFDMNQTASMLTAITAELTCTGAEPYRK